MLCLAFAAGPATAGPVVGEPAEVVFDWSADRCARWDIPDTPARAWRGGDGRVRLVSGSEESRASVGPNLGALTRDCGVLYRGSGADDPAAGDDRVWLHAVHAEAGGRVIALGHAEYHGHLRRDRCPVGGYLACWSNAIVELVSEDGGATFRRDGPAVAAPPPYTGRAGRRTGYFNPSNIVRQGGMLHAFIYAEAGDGQRPGPCLLRRPEAGGAADWRAWDGRGFSVRLDGTGAGCVPVGGIRSTISGVVRHVPTGKWLAVTPTTRTDAAGRARTGIWWAVSDDLVAWTRPELLWEVPLAWRRDCAAAAAYGYPALLDAASPDRDFASVGADFWLYLVAMPLGPGCRLGPERDLIRLPVSWPSP